MVHFLCSIKFPLVGSSLFPFKIKVKPFFYKYVYVLKFEQNYQIELNQSCINLLKRMTHYLHILPYVNI